MFPSYDISLKPDSERQKCAGPAQVPIPVHLLNQSGCFPDGHHHVIWVHVQTQQLSASRLNSCAFLPEDPINKEY